MKRQNHRAYAALDNHLQVVKKHNKSFSSTDEPVHAMIRSLNALMSDLRASKNMARTLLGQCKALLSELSELKERVEEEKNGVESRLAELQDNREEVQGTLDDNRLYVLRKAIKELEKREKSMERDGFQLIPCNCQGFDFGHTTNLDCVQYELGELRMEEARYDQTGEWGSDVDDEHAFYLEDKDSIRSIKDEVEELQVQLKLCEDAVEAYEDFFARADRFAKKLETLKEMPKKELKGYNRTFEEALRFRNHLSDDFPSLASIVSKMERVVRSFAHLSALQAGANDLKGVIAEMFLSSIHPNSSHQMHFYVNANANEAPIIRKYDLWCSKTKVAFECKSVLKPLDNTYRKQWLKDLRLLQLGIIQEIQWHFVPVLDEDIEHSMEKLKALFVLPNVCDYLEKRAFVVLYKRIDLQNIQWFERSKYTVQEKKWKHVLE
jgi:gas vesicle protein